MSNNGKYFSLYNYGLGRNITKYLHYFYFPLIGGVTISHTGPTEEISQLEAEIPRPGQLIQLGLLHSGPCTGR